MTSPIGGTTKGDSNSFDGGETVLTGEERRSDGAPGICAPTEIRTPVLGLKGLRPSPLDDGGIRAGWILPSHAWGVKAKRPDSKVGLEAGLMRWVWDALGGTGVLSPSLKACSAMKQPGDHNPGDRTYRISRPGSLGQ